MTNTETLPAMCATDSRLFVWRDESPAILARIDSRGTGRALCHRYAPLSHTPSGVDIQGAFWDTWGEVEVLDE